MTRRLAFGSALLRRALRHVLALRCGSPLALSRGRDERGLLVALCLPTAAGRQGDHGFAACRARAAGARLHPLRGGGSAESSSRSGRHDGRVAPLEDALGFAGELGLLGRDGGHGAARERDIIGSDIDSAKSRDGGVLLLQHVQQATGCEHRRQAARESQRGQRREEFGARLAGAEPQGGQLPHHLKRK
eukprot:scaffold1154_cov310-Pinguiococcus_pyrenoidosus.AAC.8